MLSRIHLQNDDINCLCLVYNAATGAKIILTWNMQFNYPWMNLACVGLRAHGATQPLISVSTRSVTGPCPSKRTTEQIQCHTDCVCVCVCYRCWQTCIWHLQTAAWKHLLMCWGNNLDPAAEKKKKSLFFPREMCFSQDGHITDTRQSHRISGIVSH